MKIQSLMLFTATLSLGLDQALAADISINVDGIRNNNGKLLLAIFNQQKAFENQDSEKAFATVVLPARQDGQSFTLHDVPEGKYAISLHHDENANGKFDLNKRQFPLEGFAYSNGVGMEKEVTEFPDAAFEHQGSSSKQTIKMIYIK